MTKRRSRRENDLEDGLINFVLILILGLAYLPEYLRWRFFDHPANAWLGWLALGMGLILILVVVGIVNRSNARHTRRKLLTRDNLQTLTPDEFEQYVAGLFEAKGFSATVTGRTGDGGVDIKLHKGSVKAIVQCKRYRRSVGVQEIREFSDVAMRADAQRAFFVTTSEFTAGAIDWARDNPKIKLIDNHALYSMLQDSKIGPFGGADIVPSVYIGRGSRLGLALLAVGLNSTLCIGIMFAINEFAAR